MQLLLCCWWGRGFLIRSFQLLNLVDRGFDTTRLLTVSVPLPYEKYKEPARGQAFFEEAIQRLESLPGVEGAATAPRSLTPFRGTFPTKILSWKANGFIRILRITDETL